MDKPKAILMDLDGTIYAGNVLIPGAAETVQFIKSNNVRLFFFTNNSERTRKEIADKLNNLGIPCIEEDIVSSGYIAINLVKSNKYSDVFVSGSDSFKKEFNDAGIKLSVAPLCRTLIIGMDSKFNYEKLTLAVNAALNAERIIACNKDRIFPVEDGTFRPGCGAMVSSIEFCSKKKAQIIVGKPSKFMMDFVCDQEHTTPGKIIVIGDTFDSDTKMAIDTGAHNILIGENDKAEFQVSEIKDVVKILETHFGFNLLE